MSVDDKNAVYTIHCNPPNRLSCAISFKLSQQIVDELSANSVDEFEVVFTSKEEGKFIVEGSEYPFKSLGGGQVEIFTVGEEAAELTNFMETNFRFTITGDLDHVGSRLREMKNKTQEEKNAKATARISMPSEKRVSAIPHLTASKATRKLLPQHKPVEISSSQHVGSAVEWLLLQRIPAAITGKDILTFFKGLVIERILTRNRKMQNGNVLSRDILVQFDCPAAVDLAILRQNEHCRSHSFEMEVLTPAAATWLVSRSVSMLSTSEEEELYLTASQCGETALDLLMSDFAGSFDCWAEYSSQFPSTSDIFDDLPCRSESHTSSSKNGKKRKFSSSSGLTPEYFRGLGEPTFSTGSGPELPILLTTEDELRASFRQASSVKFELDRIASSLMLLVMNDPLTQCTGRIELLEMVKRSRRVYRYLIHLILKKNCLIPFLS